VRRVSRRLITLGAAVVLVLGTPLLVAWMLRPDDSAGPCVVANGPAPMPEVPESSGLAVSRRHPGLLWTHNDSGSDSVLFAVDAAGDVHARVRLAAGSHDWEDISAARCPPDDCLYIADIGDNRRSRRRVQIYRVPEPAAGDSQTAQPEVFNATYADGPHNAEAMFVVGADVFIITRDRTGAVYRSTVGSPGKRDVTLERIGELGLSAVTDAETARDGTSVVVRTSHEAVFYRTADVSGGSFVPYLRIPLDGLKESQGEGVALDGSMLYLSSEGRPWSRAGKVLSLRCSFSH
jgi:hypothetical protein